MHTAKDYRTAASIARESGGLTLPAAADAWELEAAKLEKRELFAEKLGLFIEDALNPRDSTLFNGTRLLTALLNQGWTPPEGLF